MLQEPPIHNASTRQVLRKWLPESQAVSRPFRRVPSSSLLLPSNNIQPHNRSLEDLPHRRRSIRTHAVTALQDSRERQTSRLLDQRTMICPLFRGTLQSFVSRSCKSRLTRPVSSKGRGLCSGRRAHVVDIAMNERGLDVVGQEIFDLGQAGLPYIVAGLLREGQLVVRRNRQREAKIGR